MAAILSQLQSPVLNLGHTSYKYFKPHTVAAKLNRNRALHKAQETKKKRPPPFVDVMSLRYQNCPKVYVFRHMLIYQIINVTLSS